MKTILKKGLFLFLSCLYLQGQAQTFTATVQDAVTGEPVPFATIQLSENRGTITNEEGIFTMEVGRSIDSISISSMGYDKVFILPKKETDTIIKLPVKINELGNVYLTDKALEVTEIIERIKENIPKNYPNTLTEKKIFFRQSVFNKMDKMAIEVEKTSIPEFNQAFMDSLLRAIPTKSDYYSESVGILSGNYSKQKLAIEKAAKLYDKAKTGVGVTNFAKRLEEIVKKNVKPDSYFKIKSGIIGTTIEANGNEVGDSDNGIKIEVNTEDDPSEEDITASVKAGISALQEAMFFQEDTKLDFLTKSNRYKFIQRSYTFIGDAVVYIIDFVPKGKKDFKGTLYVNTEDYAIVRLEYENVRKLASFGLFGISYRQYLYNGKSIYEKDEHGGYSLRYMELENGVKFALDRPLKIIEKNKNVRGRRKQNEVAMELDMGNTVVEKKEFVVFNSSVITESAYEEATESTDAIATYLSAYDATFWEGYTIIEPNAVIQSFKVIEE